MIELRAVYVITARELKKLLRERTRLLSTIARPVIWLAFVGVGLSRLVPTGGDITYLQFFFPGVVAMTILFSAIFSAISIIWDKEFGYMKEILVAPVSRSSISIGKAVSGSVVSTAQATVVLLLFPFVGLHLQVGQVLLAVALSGLLSFCLASLGILIATFYESFESFSIIMNFIVMPMFFLSGAMYPIKQLPPLLAAMARMNPLTYGVDALKNVLLPGTDVMMSADFPLLTDILVLSFLSLLFLFMSTESFKRRI